MPKDSALYTSHRPATASPLRALGLAEVALQGPALQISAQHPTLAELPRPIPLKAPNFPHTLLDSTTHTRDLNQASETTHVLESTQLDERFATTHTAPRTHPPRSAPFSSLPSSPQTPVPSGPKMPFSSSPHSPVPSSFQMPVPSSPQTPVPSGPKTPAHAIELLATQSRRSTVLPRSAAHLHEGDLLFGQEARYEHLKPLGQGGAGDVLLARDNDIQRMVAVKKLKKQLQETPAVMRFVEEIRTVGQLEHPNIVPIHDVGIDQDGQYYFVMKYVDGQTMEQIIDKLKANDPETTRRFPIHVRNQIFLKILEAIEFAHSKGWIHRDIKPSNIMIGPHGEVMVMDWGLAKQIREEEILFAPPSIAGAPQQPLHTLSLHTPTERMIETRHDTLLGTPAYMAPEQALGHNQRLDERSDIYSLSALYYEWISLHHYMQHKHSLQEMLYGIIHEAPKPLHSLRSEHNPIPPELTFFALQGLQKDPAQRYASIAAMREALQTVLDGHFGVHCPVTFNKRAANEFLHFTNRHPAASISLTVGALVLAALGTMQALSLLAALF